MHRDCPISPKFVDTPPYYQKLSRASRQLPFPALGRSCPLWFTRICWSRPCPHRTNIPRPPSPNHSRQRLGRSLFRRMVGVIFGVWGWTLQTRADRSRRDLLRGLRRGGECSWWPLGRGGGSRWPIYDRYPWLDGSCPSCSFNNYNPS